MKPGRPVINRNKIGRKEAKRLADSPPGLRANNLGVAGDPSVEPIPEFIQTASEKVITNHQNSWIVLGRDRPGTMLSGKGGAGDTGCASMDLVVGRLSANPMAKTPQDKTIYVNPDFTRDAARIYISQKTDIDKNFGLEDGATGSGNMKNRSAIAVKADVIRVIGREGVKIISGGDTVNSQNARITELRGIDLIAYGQDSELQPLVKGENLSDALNSIATQVDNLAAVVKGLLITQMTLNQAFVEHTHASPFFFNPTTPSFEAMQAGPKALMDHFQYTISGLDTVRSNVKYFQEKYLNNMMSNAHINSRHNKTT